MECGICEKSVYNCTCDDLTARMRKATDGRYVVVKWCTGCDEYYPRCKCENPMWRLRTDGKLAPMPVELQ